MAGGLTISTLNDSSGVLATQNGMSGICKGWVNFDSAGTIRGSFNVSSVTRNTTGDFSINFTTAMPDTNYSASMSMRRAGTNDVIFACPFGVTSGTAFSTTSLRIRVFNSSPTAENPDTGCVQVFR